MSDAESDYEDYTYDINKWGGGRMSLRSKLEALHDHLDIDLPLPRHPSVSDRTETRDGRILSLKLPPPAKLLYLLEVFFHEHNDFFPCVDRQTFESSLLDWISSKSYGQSNHIVTILPSETRFAAMTCLVFAVTEFIDPDAVVPAADLEESVYHRSRSWYQKSTKLLRYTRRLPGPFFDMVCYHTLEAMYLHYIDHLADASQAVARAVSLSHREGLNNQTTFADCPPELKLARRKLWWSLYYVDRKVAERCGHPYYLRDLEIDVEDFSVPSLSDERAISRSRGTAILDNLQGAIVWARLWAQMWDTFFALKAQSLGDAEEVEAMDARIIAAMQSVPTELMWDTAPFESHPGTGGSTGYTRFGLLTVTVRVRPWLEKLVLIIGRRDSTYCV